MDDAMRAAMKNLGDILEGRAPFPIAFSRPTLQELVTMGAMLCDIKKNLGHGKFMEWVKAECPFSYRTAHRYMRAYRGFCVLTKSDTLADLNGEEEPTDGRH